MDEEVGHEYCEVLKAEANPLALDGGRCCCESLAVNPTKRKMSHVHELHLESAQADAGAGRWSRPGCDPVTGELRRFCLWRLDLDASWGERARIQEGELLALHEFHRRDCHTEDSFV